MHHADPVALMQTCRKLFLRRHEVLVQIGVHAFEKTAPQRLWIDVELWVPFAHSTHGLAFALLLGVASSVVVYLALRRMGVSRST